MEETHIASGFPNKFDETKSPRRLDSRVQQSSLRVMLLTTTDAIYKSISSGGAVNIRPSRSRGSTPEDVRNTICAYDKQRVRTSNPTPCVTNDSVIHVTFTPSILRQPTKTYKMATLDWRVLVLLDRFCIQTHCRKVSESEHKSFAAGRMMEALRAGQIDPNTGR